MTTDVQPHAPTRPRDADDARTLLGIYLRDHLGGAAGALALVKRSRRANAGNEFEPLLAEMEAAIVADREALRLVMRRLGVSESRVKQAIGAGAELVGRLKSNGRIVHYSPSARVVELEALIGGVTLKRELWRTLHSVASDYHALDQSELDRLTERASAQLRQLQTGHQRATELAFARFGN